MNKEDIQKELNRKDEVLSLVKEFHCIDPITLGEILEYLGERDYLNSEGSDLCCLMNQVFSDGVE